MITVKPVLSIQIAFVSLSEFVDAYERGQVPVAEELLQQSAHFIPKKRQQFLCGRWLLSLLMQRDYQCSILPLFGQAQNGRPCFADSMLPDFNITHSGDWVMIALSPDGKVGLDIETPRSLPDFLPLARHSFSQIEAAYLETLTEGAQLPYFWRLWTVREAILKLNALSVWQMKELYLAPLAQSIQTSLASDMTVLSFEHEAFTWAIACRQENPECQLLQVDLGGGVSIKECLLEKEQQWSQNG